MTTLDDTTRQFLAVLHRGGQFGYWWTLEGRRSFWWKIEKPQALPNGRRNVYFGVHPTTAIPPASTRGEKKPPQEVRAQLPYIAAINCLYCEYDAKDFGGDKDAARQSAESMQPAPSIIIDSGAGYHVYHLFDVPWLLTSDADRAQAKRLQAAWVAYTGSDPQVKDLARVLRVPGTTNYKYDPPRPVVFVVAHLDRRYRCQDLESACAHLMEDDRLPTQPALDHPSSFDRREQRYALGALDREVANVLRAPGGKKHDTIRDAALKLGTFVPRGLLTEDQIIDELTRAANLHRADVKDTYRAVLDGIAYGKQRPREIPKPKPFRRVDQATGEILDPPQGKEYIPAPDWQKTGITLAELQHKYFEPERWIIENILPEGACLLAAKYKSKKSWLALALSLAVAMQGKALGRLGVSSGRVLYLDLEGKQQRIQKRTRAMLGVRQADWPANFHIFTKWPQGDEGMQQLLYWFATYPDTALVVVDVLASFRRPIQKHEEPYRYDRDTIDPLNELFERHHAGGILVHHFNKGKHDDIMDSITGTTGIPSAVSTMWGLSRDVNDSAITVLHLRGRDLENEEPLALKWDSYLNQHVIEGNANDVAVTAERRAVLKALDDDQPHTPKEIAIELGKPVPAVQFLIRKLLNEGLIDKVGYGKYARIAQSAQTPQSAQSTQSAQSLDKEHTNSEWDSESLSGTLMPTQSSPGLSEAVNTNSEHSEWDSQGDVQSSINAYEQANADFWKNVIAERTNVTVNPHAQPFNVDNTLFVVLPPAKRTTLRLYLQSNKEQDQERARELCEEYSIDYQAAYAAVRGQ